MSRPRSPLPVDAVLGDLEAALDRRGAAVLVAEPGAGKTTRVPPRLAARHAGRGRVLVLEPRRIAARAAAERMAEEDGSAPGTRFGYHVRFERRFGPDTAVVVLTEGILTRRLQDDPALEGVAAVVLDEFHERSLHADLALAFLDEVRRSLRPDLEVVVMSATLDAERVAAFLDAEVVRSTGRTHPIAVEHRPLADMRRPVAGPTASAARALIEDGSRGVLAFLPGAGEIAAALRETGGAGRFDVLPLHGELPLERQRAALRAASRPRIVFATNVAETSLTVEGIDAVVDSGLERRAGFDADLGLDRLELVRIARASADQRAGRAGRLGPGRCVRLWSQGEDAALAPFAPPEIRRVDLGRTVLEVLAWGASDPSAFRWFEAPEPAAIEQAIQVLERLGALRRTDGGLRLTALGRELLGAPMHPRIARVLAASRRLGVGEDGAVMAALCSERDVRLERRAFAAGRGAARASSSSDVLDVLDLYRRAAAEGFGAGVCARLGLDGRGLAAVRRLAARLERAGSDAVRGRASPPPPPPARGRTSGVSAGDGGADEALRRALLAGYPDRVARRRAPRAPEALMVGGRGVKLDPASSVLDAELFVAVEITAGRRGSLSSSPVRVASAVEEAWLEEDFPEALGRRERVVFDERLERAVTIEERTFFDLVIRETRGGRGDPAAESAALVAALRARPDAVVDLSGALGGFVARAALLREAAPELGVPDIDVAYLAELLATCCDGRRSFEELRRLPLLDVLRGSLARAVVATIDAEMPESIALPSGRRVPVRWEKGKDPVIAARVQDLFGLWEPPRLAGGRLKPVFEILAPNHRPAQITADIAGFWRNGYARVRKDLRGRYPKHDWPERPPEP